MLRNEILIEADPHVVWALTADVERWPQLTPTITEVVLLDEGPITLGGRARIAQPRQRPAVWTVSRFEPDRRFEWWTKVGPITMTGGHRIEPDPRGCRNILTLEVTGRGSGLLRRLAGRRLAEAIDTENRGFRSAAEGLARTTDGPAAGASSGGAGPDPDGEAARPHR
jgi:hypothetical protein